VKREDNFNPQRSPQGREISEKRQGGERLLLCKSKKKKSPMGKYVEVVAREKAGKRRGANPLEVESLCGSRGTGGLLGNTQKGRHAPVGKEVRKMKKTTKGEEKREILC